jgi:hypothetical protein
LETEVIEQPSNTPSFTINRTNNDNVITIQELQWMSDHLKMEMKITMQTEILNFKKQKKLADPKASTHQLIGIYVYLAMHHINPETLQTPN